MRATATTPAPLVPTLADAINKRIKHDPTTLQPGDQLHFTAPVLGFQRGLTRPLFGYCVHTDGQGKAYAVTAYVQPLALDEHAIGYAQRQALRYPTDNQKEVWFGAVLMYLIEVDLTDYADCLRLERLSERVLPLLPAAVVVPAYPQAA